MLGSVTWLAKYFKREYT